MKLFLIVVIILSQLMIICLSLYAMHLCKKLLNDLGVIENPDDLDYYKSCVKLQMYFTLGYIALLAVCFGCVGYGLVGGHLKWNELFYVFILVIFQTLVGPKHKSIEESVRSMPVEDPDLQYAYEHVNQVWIHKALPKW